MYRSGDSAAAVPVLQQYLQSDPHNVGIRSALILHLLRTGDQKSFAREASILMVTAPHSELGKKLLANVGPAVR